MKVNEESENVGVKLNIQKTNIVASVPITSWQIDGETMETGRDFIFLGSEITDDGDYRHEIKRRLLLGRKAMTNLDSILSFFFPSWATEACAIFPDWGLNLCSLPEEPRVLTTGPPGSP